MICSPIFEKVSQRTILYVSKLFSKISFASHSLSASAVVSITLVSNKNTIQNEKSGTVRCRFCFWKSYFLINTPHPLLTIQMPMIVVNPISMIIRSVFASGRVIIMMTRTNARAFIRMSDQKWVMSAW